MGDGSLCCGKKLSLSLYLPWPVSWKFRKTVLNIRAREITVGDKRSAWPCIRNGDDRPTASARQAAIPGTGRHVLARHPFYRILEGRFSRLRAAG